MKTLSLFLLFVLPVLTVSVKTQAPKSSFLEINQISEFGFRWSNNSGSVSSLCDFIYLGNDNFFVSGIYSNSQSPYYSSCVGLANFNSNLIWRHDYFADDIGKSSNLSKTSVNGENLYTATTPNGLNYYSVTGEIKKTITQLSGNKTFFAFCEQGLVVTLVNGAVWAHKINFDSGQLLDSLYITSGASWIDDAKDFAGNIYLSIRKPDGGVSKTLVVKLDVSGVIWQTTISKIGKSYLAITPSVTYIAGDSVTMTGTVSKLITLNSEGIELWRRSFEYPNFGKMTLSRSLLINPYNNDCIIGGYIADPDAIAYFCSWNEHGESLWEFIDSNGLSFLVSNLFWNENKEMIVCGEGRRTSDNSYGALIKKYFIPGVTTDVADKTPSPTSFTLEQNYPNPFNPSTTITFTVPVETKVTLKVYDVLGKEVAELINGVHHPAGTYQVPFDGHKLPSGVYLYTLKTTDNYSMTKKMVLIK